jgi:methenyltetrahydromethanopterin cyclohydrolase
MRGSSEESALDRVISVNRLARRILEKLLSSPDLYGIEVEETATGTTIIDAGIKAKGGFEAGRLITEICMGGCAKAEITSRSYGDLELPTILVYSDNPLIATLGSQYAGWRINEEGYSAICSGPARALASKPKKIFDEIEYTDKCDKTIMILETDKIPGQKILERFCKECKVSSENLTIILTPTTSVSGAVQISGRIIETGMHKLRRLGLDMKSVLHAFGYAPIAPVHEEFAVAMARTNDAILYGGTAYYTVGCGDEEKLREIVKKAPSSASKAYGRPFRGIFKDADFDFYKVDPDLFAPAVLIINSTKTGNTYINGKINVEALKQSFGS